MQRLYDWRGKFAIKAVNEVAAFFREKNVASNSAEDIEWRAHYATHALGPGLPFMYRNGDPKVQILHPFVRLAHKPGPTD